MKYICNAPIFPVKLFYCYVSISGVGIVLYYTPICPHYISIRLLQYMICSLGENNRGFLFLITHFVIILCGHLSIYRLFQ